MRCGLCSDSAGWLHRVCGECRTLRDLFVSNRGADIGTMMDTFIASGVSRSKIELFLESDYEGNGTIRDHIAADMANDLLAAFGQVARKTPAEVKRLRERGAWVHMDRPPDE